MSKKILIVDDEPDIIKMVEMRLMAFGYQVITANNGIDGLSLARSQSPDLIILDVMMPQMDGFNVCRMLKFDEKYKHIPIILLTGRDQKADQQVGKDVQADLYIIKPFAGDKLLKEVQQLLSLTQPKNQTAP